MIQDTNRQHQCPVCHMSVDNDGISLAYQQQVYRFCSQQCRDRFQANPHLYIGRPGHPAPKQHGHEIIKTRKLKLAEPLSKHQSTALDTALREMMGIRDVQFEPDCVCITYDLMQATAAQIEETIEQAGNRLASGLGNRLKQAFINYLEESELDNLEQPGQGHRH